MKNDNLVSQFSEILFWDTDKTDLDFELHKNWIVRRVVSYGTLDDLKLLVKIYSKPEIAHILAGARKVEGRMGAWTNLLIETWGTASKLKGNEYELAL